jgi:hypothetical protein
MLQRWIKTGKILEPLIAPMDENGKELYFGSMIDFDKIPVPYHSRDTLKFYLDTRQIKAPDTLAEIRQITSMVWSSHGSQLKPIPKILMRGVSGWIKEEVLMIKDAQNDIEWVTQDKLLRALEGTFPIFTEDSFTAIFKKRNGTRLRLLKHITGGSYDLPKLKATYGMVHKLYPDSRLLVIESSCAPSQKLKEDNKDAFHNQRLCMELDEDNKFVKFHNHPATTCGCPNGCIWCAHLGGLLGLCHAHIKFCKNLKETTRVACDNSIDEDILEQDNAKDNENITEDVDEYQVTFEDIQSHFPQTVHSVLKQPMATTYTFPAPGTKEKILRNTYRREHSMNGIKGGGKDGRQTIHSTLLLSLICWRCP